MSKLMYSCEEASRLSSRALEEPLTPTQRVLLRMHLLMCKRCGNFAGQFALLRRASRKLPEVLEKDTG